MSPITRGPFEEIREAQARRREQDRLRQQKQQQKVIGVSGDERPTIDIKRAQAETQRGTQLRQQEKREQLAIKVRQIRAGKITQKQKNIYDSLAQLNKVLAGEASIRTSDAKNFKKIQEAQIKQVQAQFNEVQKNRDKYRPGAFQTYSQSVGQYLKDANQNLEDINRSIEQGTVTKAQLKSQIKQLQEEALKPQLKKSYTYKTLPKKLPTEEEKQRNKAIDSLLKSKLAERVGNTITLTKDYRGFTDKQIKTAQQAGFNVSDEENLSFSILEYGEKNLKGRNKRLTEYASVVVGSGEKVYDETIGAIVSFVQGKPNQRNRSVTPETIGYVRNLSKSDKIYLGIGVDGTQLLANYYLMEGVGTAVGGVFKGSASIAKASGLKSPQAVSRIANEIAKHPRLAQAVLLAPIAGVEASEVYEQYKAGVPIEKILSNEAMRAGNLYAQMKGLEAGFKLPNKVEQWWKTRGRSLIPPEELFRAVTLETGELPAYEGKVKKSWSTQFKDLAKKLSAEKYLGAVAEDEYRVWHGTKSPFAIKVGEELQVLPGYSLNKFPGLFVAPEPSPLRLPGLTTAEASRLGIPGVRGVSEIASIDALVEVMPSGMTRAEAQAWLNAQVGTKTAYIPPVSMITREMEAVIPTNSLLVKVGEDWYTNWSGHRVLVNKYILVSEGTPLSSLPKGSTIVKLSEISSTLPISETYLTFGIIPETTGSLTKTQMEYLSKAYGLSEAQIKSLGSDIGSTLKKIRIPTTTTDIVEKTDLTEILEEPSTGITSITITPPEEIPEPSEPPSTPEPTEPVETPLETPPKSVSKREMENRRKLNLSLFYGKTMLYKVIYNFKDGKSQTIGPFEARSFYDAIQKAQRKRRVSKNLPISGSIILVGEVRK